MARNRMRAIPLGGIGEVGKNMMIVEYRGDMVMIDSGTKFPEEEMRGIDLIIPDITYVIQNIQRFRAQHERNTVGRVQRRAAAAHDLPEHANRRA